MENVGNGSLGESQQQADNDLLILQAYYMYNHGSNSPPLFTQPIGGGTPVVNPSAASAALNNALTVMYYYDPAHVNDPFPNPLLPDGRPNPNYIVLLGGVQPWVKYAKNLGCQ